MAARCSSVLFGGLAALGLLATAGAVAVGVVVMTSK